ncbi:MAG TPA: hypothetical protein VHU24_03115, partial [Solirubrobacterales bacterium]|nr:hypothetical protein [Solirubrobacterales bacterium]
MDEDAGAEAGGVTIAAGQVQVPQFTLRATATLPSGGAARAEPFLDTAVEIPTTPPTIGHRRYLTRIFAPIVVRQEGGSSETTYASPPQVFLDFYVGPLLVQSEQLELLGRESGGRLEYISVFGVDFQNPVPVDFGTPLKLGAHGLFTEIASVATVSATLFID